ncbi:hypothetical protein F5884DRAFT_314506 [Xylogone sp. PMI_703]|nr:hypothetical protein F5884DRAFT_314506 [Xylogone sp. PMI_703]
MAPLFSNVRAQLLVEFMVLSSIIHAHASPLFEALVPQVLNTNLTIVGQVAGQNPSYSRIGRRGISQDPSCPDGFLCVQQSCPSDVTCPSGTSCYNFEGTVTCGWPGLDYCALNPNTLEAVGCNGGQCCHGNCYPSDAVCCDFDTIQCSVGQPCNVRGSDQTCDNSAVSENAFTDNGGLAAVEAAAPLWYQATSACLASAAEDGQGHQTDGVDVPVVLCAINEQQDGGCPPAPTWLGAKTPYYNVQNEPFPTIPTYYFTQKCDSDNTWRVFYGVYFKHDASHKSDWEWAIVLWRNTAPGEWTRAGLLMETDGDYGWGEWNSIPDTFRGPGDKDEDGNHSRDHPKLYFSKRHHSVHYDSESRNKDTCIAPDFRANDFEWYSGDHLRSSSVIDPNWTYGRATNPRVVNLCDNRNLNINWDTNPPTVTS